MPESESEAESEEASAKPAPKSRGGKKGKAKDPDWYFRNDNMLSRATLQHHLLISNRKVSNKDLNQMHKTFNSYIDKFLTRLCENARRPSGMYTFKQFEEALKAEGLIGNHRLELRIEMMSMFTPTQYKKLKGILIPLDDEDDTLNF